MRQRSDGYLGLWKRVYTRKVMECQRHVSHFFLRRFLGVQKYYSNTGVSFWSCSCHNNYQGEIANGIVDISRYWLSKWVYQWMISYTASQSMIISNQWNIDIYILKYMYRLECNYLNNSQWLKALYVAFDVRWYEINHSKYTGGQTTYNGSNNCNRKGSKIKCMQ